MRFIRKAEAILETIDVKSVENMLFVALVYAVLAIAEVIKNKSNYE
ncbi:MAG: hypothetical protein WA061_01720 [Microgenomates group bacterium]